MKGKIFTGASKSFCVPGLNCYSCPGALGSCPIGSLQAVIGSRDFRFSFYITGFLVTVGAFLGRFVCGWLCPFGLIQDLLYKIPTGKKGVPKKKRLLPGDRWLKWLKYGILVVFVLLLPLVVADVSGLGSPWFCKYICPAGTLEGGWPLLLLNQGLRDAAGWLFAWKNAILFSLLILSVFISRPFCRYLCPLGAVYGLFHPVSLYRMEVDSHKCTSCGACRHACPWSISAYQTPNSPDCIRCGKCVSACPHGALEAGFHLHQPKAAEQKQPPRD